ncbi:MAG: hypothetical protein HOB29_01205 [Planctomycetaceae bacterium]|nr:hypothetical protein [Planctomycetaceae bacterium]
MNVPVKPSHADQRITKFKKSNLTWLVVGGAGLTIVPFIIFVMKFIQRVKSPVVLLEHVGKTTQESMTGTEDMLTYVLLLFMGLAVIGILAGLIGTLFLVAQYDSEMGFKMIRAGCGTALCCQGILIICACTIWVAKALALFNGDLIEEGVRIVYTPDRLTAMSTAVFFNDGMIWGVWVVILPVFLTIYFAEKDLHRRIPSHI